MNDNQLLKELFTSLASLTKTHGYKLVISNSSGETYLLDRLNQLGGESTPSKLSQCSDFSRARLSVIIKTLQAKNFIEKIENKNDKRSVLVKITDTGKEHIETKTDQITSHIIQIVENLGEDDSTEFIRLVNKILQIEQNLIIETNSSA